ncbi:MAG: anti-anti-sigma factor [Leptothrix sp. (in: Bacteria)]|nr:anti-anti-sigma factor [Leptothrix sp. (in: b-proteobacteria)]
MTAIAHWPGLSSNGRTSVIVFTIGHLRPAPSAADRIKEKTEMNMSTSELASGVTCIRLNGRLDAPGADLIDLRFTATAAAGKHHTIVDLRGVSFVASMGLRLLISTARALHLKGASMVLFGAQELVRDVLEQAAVDQIIPLVGTEREAIEHLQP